MSNPIRITQFTAAGLLVLVLIAIFTIQASSATAPVQNAVKIGVINIDEIIASSLVGKEATANLEAM